MRPHVRQQERTQHLRNNTVPATISKPKLDVDQMQLIEMLRYRRPHGSESEKTFIDNFIINPLKSMPHCNPVHIDAVGNIHAFVPYKDDTDPEQEYVLFSCHTDTVHSDPGLQVVMVDAKSMAYIDARGLKGKQAFGECLGADCATGVWIMMHMLKRKVPGYYVFHRGEECGGIGSSFIAEDFKKSIATPIKWAIAFDRKGYNDIITHQSGIRCASQAAGEQLKKALSEKGLNYELSQNGSFTDTANYKYCVSECFNLSVGYHKQHGPNETQDMMFAKRLLDALCSIDWHSFVSFRDHEEAAKQIATHQRFPAVARETYIGTEDFLNTIEVVIPPDDVIDEFGTDADEALLRQLVTEFPELAVRLLKTLGITEADILEALEEVNPDVKFYASIQDTIFTRAVEEDSAL